MTWQGFRLERLEVFNWGTFKNKVWTLESTGATALLTGANGSGKSTLVDAFLTLLVPSRQRNYNQASGSTQRERDESSYVRGAYRRTSDESDSAIVYLRQKDTYSVLLAHFNNASLSQQVTVAQVFYWGQSGELKKFFVVATQCLSIATDFSVQNSFNDLRKRLREKGAEVYDEFSKYSATIIKRLGLRSDKALDLFNQTVSIKEIGGLNEFVRQHMLEKTNAAEKIADLRNNYENLTQAHDAIAKAEHQVTLLRPLLAEVEQYEERQAKIRETEACAEAAPFYFAKRHVLLLETALAETEAQRRQLLSQLEDANNQLTILRARLENLKDAYKQDSIGQRLEMIERELKEAQKRYEGKYKVFKDYGQLLAKIGINKAVNKTDFYDLYNQFSSHIKDAEAALEQLVDERDGYKLEEKKLAGDLEALQAELGSLLKRKSQMSAESIYIREMICQALNLNEEQLPFVGELLRVNPEAKEWEGAIERLLNPFGRQLLVRDEFYRDVSQYVNKTYLRNRFSESRKSINSNSLG